MSVSSSSPQGIAQVQLVRLAPQNHGHTAHVTMLSRGLCTPCQSQHSKTSEVGLVVEQVGETMLFTKLLKSMHASSSVQQQNSAAQVARARWTCVHAKTFDQAATNA